ncbi:MAG: exodeoxyribonuclease VII large subunit [Desulfobacteraceae bacterium]|nr:exodeoxyribonuclease VII large subunit [Desulfobacteraceae bacterium]
MAQLKDFRQIFTVSALTREIKTLIEERFPLVWISGEISNLSLPASGHAYFSLKDANAVISGVMFRNQWRRLRFRPENGMKITGMGRISLYEPRGSYQLIFEHMEPEGAGALQAAFEQLKQKLAQQGLFDEARKKAIPFLPSRISIVTSPTGAVIRDIITVAKRRFPNIPLEIVPVKVQGPGAEQEISRAVELVNGRAKSDLIIVARGGGSLEDLSAFNSEIVAMAICNSQIPVMSAVGHETDYTIADFVADLRAPTPSAAAELALPEKRALELRLNQLESTLVNGLYANVAALRERVKELTSRLRDPKRVVDDMRFRLGDLESRMSRQMEKMLTSRKERLDWFSHALYANSPETRVSKGRTDIDALLGRLTGSMASILTESRSRTNEGTLRLEALSPMSVLDRGYSITRKYPEKTILMDSTMTEKNETVEVILARGRLRCQVEETYGKEEDI